MPTIERIAFMPGVVVDGYDSGATSWTREKHATKVQPVRNADRSITFTILTGPNTGRIIEVPAHAVGPVTLVPDAKVAPVKK